MILHRLMNSVHHSFRIKFLYVLLIVGLLYPIQKTWAQVSPQERQALIDLYNATDGDNWKNTKANNQSWKINDPNSLVSDWYGVTVVDRKVTSLDLSNNNLKGVISKTLGQLVGLNNLKLPYNDLSGGIPVEFRFLTKLKHLELNDNGLTGNIPIELGILTEMTTLNLDINQLSGRIPKELGQLTKLNELILSRNKLSGILPKELANLRILKTLNAANNQLSGEIPKEFGVMNNLEFLFLLHNGFTGLIPPDIGNMTSLKTLGLSYNNLSGKIPSELGKLTNVNLFYLNNNKLEGSIPIELSSLVNVRILALHYNNLTGNIPSEFKNLNNLTSLLLNDNNLEGSIPEALNLLPSLRIIDIQNNKFSGKIPNLVNVIDYRFSFYDNNFVFSDFENEHASYKWTTIYEHSPQAKVDQIETVSITENGTITLTSAALTSANNSYQWYKDGVAITGATSKEYVINNATATDAGVYHFKATNSIITGLTLERNPITLTVSPDVDTCGVSAAEKQALIDLYNSTDGANWTNNTNWLTDAPVCDWFGVTVANGTVMEIKLYNNNLIGTLPGTISQLVSIKELNLYKNELSGTIPIELSQLSNLENLRLANNKFSGKIPSALSLLANLKTLFLENNKLSGTIPLELSQLSNLTFLRLSNNQLTGSIPIWISQIVPLRTLLLDGNQFSGKIPAIPFANLFNTFYIQNNEFVFSDFESEFVQYQTRVSKFSYAPQAKVDQTETQSVTENGTITLTSTALTSANNSYQWYKDGVAITGATSKEYVISNAKTTDAGVYHFTATNSIITGLTLERSPITLTVSPDVDTCGVSTAEKQALIDLYNSTNGANWTNNTNWLTDAPVCDWFGVTVVEGKVYNIQLFGNNLSGTLPTSIGSFLELQSLRLGNNKLTGSLPVELNLLSNLKTLSLAINQLSGSIPKELGKISRLEHLNLGQNEIIGGVPIELGALLNIEELNISDNQLSGSIPKELGDLLNLRYLTLHKNQLSGEIPIAIGRLINLEAISLYSNKLTGTIPSELGDLTSLKVMLLHSNQLSSGIPASFEKLVNLQDLWLHSNQLSGQIPSFLGNLTTLRQVLMSSNQLTGQIPPSFGNLVNLQSLWLGGNQLTGELPLELSKLTNLRQFYINDNSLSGKIPAIVNGLASVEFARFQGNNFIFSNFESEFDAYQTKLGANFQYVPQAKVDETETLSVLENGTITLTSTALTSANNSYQWYKDGVAITGATSKGYVISNATASDAGVYHFTATNSIVTGLTLERNPITIELRPDTGIEGANLCLANNSEEYPIIFNLVPHGDHINWYLTETGGDPLSDDANIVEEAENSGGVTYWWDDTTDGLDVRTPLVVTISDNVPVAEEFQVFSVGMQATVGDLQAEGDEIEWYLHPVVGNPLPLDTPLEHLQSYFAQDTVGGCRTPVSVLLQTDPPYGEGYQSVCDGATLADLQLQVLTGSTIIWYNQQTEGSVVPETTPLTHGMTYYASQIDSYGVESVDRKEVTVNVITVSPPYVSDTEQIFYANQSQTIGDLRAIGNGIRWYDQPTGGTTYTTSDQLVNGEIYYAEQQSENGCTGIRQGVLVTILEEETPALFGCESFKPNIGDRYVVNAWVKEQGFNPVNPDIRQFNGSDESQVFVSLLNHLKDRITSPDPELYHIPDIYIPYSDTENLNFDPLLAYVKDVEIDESKLTVYGLQLEKNTYGHVIGFSFSLNKTRTTKFKYLSPKVRVSLPLVGTRILDYRYPIKDNLDNLSLTFTDVRVENDKLFVISNFRMQNAGIYSTTLTDVEDNDSGTSGIQEEVTFYDYEEIAGYQPINYANTLVKIYYKNEAETIIESEDLSFIPKGPVIDGWQKVSGIFTIPVEAHQMTLSLMNTASDINAYFDDIRFQPYSSSMKTFVYDPMTQRLMAELDENNYATFYEYDAEGGLVRVKKETERGVYTIQESRSGTAKSTN